MSKYISSSQQRVLRTLDVLFGHEVNGLSPSQISKLVQCTPSNTTHDLANLKHIGFIEEVQGTRCWRISPHLGRRALAILHTLDRAESQLNEVRNRFTQL